MLPLRVSPAFECLFVNMCADSVGQSVCLCVCEHVLYSSIRLTHSLTHCHLSLTCARRSKLLMRTNAVAKHTHTSSPASALLKPALTHTNSEEHT